MPIQRRSAPTYEQIASKLRVYEEKNGMSTEDFLAHCPNGIDEDDAMEWRYLAEQRKVIVNSFVRYAPPSVKQPENLENSQHPELLAA